MHTVVETPPFLVQAKEAGMDDAVRAEIVNAISENPQIGDLMQGTGGFRKFRWARPGMGKRGGYRVVSYYYSAGLPVFLIAAFAKNERDNLSQQERNDLRKLSEILVDTYKASKGKARR
jgi:hypothetical protein